MSSEPTKIFDGEQDERDARGGASSPSILTPMRRKQLVLDDDRPEPADA